MSARSHDARDLSSRDLSTVDVIHEPDDELRQAALRALGAFQDDLYASLFRFRLDVDRLLPALEALADTPRALPVVWQFRMNVLLLAIRRPDREALLQRIQALYPHRNVAVDAIEADASYEHFRRLVRARLTTTEVK